MTISQKNISDFTATLLIDDFSSLVSYPSMKSVQSNDWAEYDGLEVDLSAPKLDKKTLELSFLLADKSKYFDFIAFLLEQNHRDWYFPDVEKVFKLRVVEFSGYQEFLNKSEIKIKLSDDFPLWNYTYIPVTINQGTDDWFLEGVAFSKYGIVVLEGSENVYSEKEVKPILEVTNGLLSGVKTYDQSLKKKSRKATIKCFLNCELSNFWNIYYGFLHNWIKKNARELRAETKTYQCYYESSKVLYFDLHENKTRVRCQFDMNIVII